MANGPLDPLRASMPLILGHRGAPGRAPENTLPSFARALELGADGVELDLQRTRDELPVVIHDDRLDRTTGVRGQVSELDLAAIARLTGGVVPSFEQTTAWAAASGAWLNVELKARDLETRTVELIRARGLQSRTLLSSFDPQVVRNTARLAPELPSFLLSERWDLAAQADLLASEAVGICLHDAAATEAVLAELRDRALPVIVWTVNAAPRIRHLLRAGVAGVISDEPGVAAAQRRDLRA